MNKLPANKNLSRKDRWFRPVLAILGPMLLAGCVHTTTLPLEDLAHSLDKDIVVTTKAGETIRFSAGSFEVDLNDSGRILRTDGLADAEQTGKLLGVERRTLAFSDIVTVEIHEKTAFYYTGPVVFGAFIVVYLALHGNMRQ